MVKKQFITWLLAWSNHWWSPIWSNHVSYVSRLIPFAHYSQLFLGFFWGGGVRPPSYHVQGLWVAGTEPSCHWGTFWIERLIYLTCTSLNCGRSWDTQREPTATANSAQSAIKPRNLLLSKFCGNPFSSFCIIPLTNQPTNQPTDTGENGERN